MGSAGRWFAGIALATLAAGGCVYGRVAFTADSRRFATVAYADPDAGEKDAVCELWVTDVASGAHQLVEREAVVGFSAAWSGDGKELWYLHGPKAERLQLRRWDGETKQEFGVFALKDDAGVFAMTPPQISADGGVFVTYGAHIDLTCVQRIDASTGARVNVAQPAGGAVLSPKGDRIAFLAWEAAKPKTVTLCVASPLGRNRRVVAPIHEKLNRVGHSPLAWAPDGSRIAWTDAPDATTLDDAVHVIWIADVASGAPRRVSGDDRGCTAPLFSADGATLFYATLAKGGAPVGVRRADLATGRIESVPGTERCLAAGVSPDGRWLAVRRAFRKNADGVDEMTVVRLVPLDGGAARDDWVTARQRRACALDEVVTGEERLAAGDAPGASAAGARADEALAAMAKDFPGSEAHADVAALRTRIAALRAAK